jgi:alpha-L-fucosidase
MSTIFCASCLPCIKRTLIFVLLFIPWVHKSFGQEINAPGSRMEWFTNARLGIFIHWGIYSVKGIDKSWSFYNGKIPYEDYMKQINGFTASKWKPDDWASAFANSGAKYVVLTSKHHDGVALWPSKCGGINLPESSPAKRDLIGPFVKAIRNKGLKVGLYYSLIDWSYPDYPNFTRTEKRYENDSIRFKHFTDYDFCQIQEISQIYKPDLFWFDGDWEQNAEQWKAQQIRELILRDNPNAIINSRLAGYGDYATPENGPPIFRPDAPIWELCLTMNDSWGYQPFDTNYKSANQIIAILADCIYMGGNLLLDIGPREDGTIPEEQLAILNELGRWTSKHSEAVYGTLPGIPAECYYGPSCISKDSTSLYLFLNGKPTGSVSIKGLKRKVIKAEVLGTGNEIPFKLMMKPSWSSYPGILYLDIPIALLDPQMTVIKLYLNGKINTSIQ